VPITRGVKAVNLLPPDLRSAPKRARTAAPAARPPAPGGSGPFLVLGALAICLLGLAAYVLAGNLIHQREAELARITSEHQGVTQRASQLKPYADFDALVDSRAAAIKAVAGQRFDWAQAFDDLARAIPREATLSSLEASVSSGSGGGSSVRGAIAKPAISLVGCTEGHRGVTRLLARLHTVRGATRVSLAKSDATETPATEPGTTDSAASSDSSCRKGSTDFDVVVFFERSTATASAEASAAATAAPSAGAAATATATPAGTDTQSASTTATSGAAQ
jgi:Tfp pilus assembly protein PilN